LFLRHQTRDKVHKHNSFNTNTPSSESYKNNISQSILNFGTRWRWVVSFTLRPLYPQGKSLWYPLDRMLGGPQNLSEHGGEEKNSQPLPKIEPPISQPIAQRYTTELSRFYPPPPLLQWYLAVVNFKILHFSALLFPTRSWHVISCVSWFLVILRHFINCLTCIASNGNLFNEYERFHKLNLEGSGCGLFYVLPQRAWRCSSSRLLVSWPTFEPSNC
jgi:hypothetical protein